MSVGGRSEGEKKQGNNYKNEQITLNLLNKKSFGLVVFPCPQGVSVAFLTHFGRYCDIYVSLLLFCLENIANEKP